MPQKQLVLPSIRVGHLEMPQITVQILHHAVLAFSVSHVFWSLIWYISQRKHGASMARIVIMHEHPQHQLSNIQWRPQVTFSCLDLSSNDLTQCDVLSKTTKWSPGEWRKYRKSCYGTWRTYQASFWAQTTQTCPSALEWNKWIMTGNDLLWPPQTTTSLDAELNEPTTKWPSSAVCSTMLI